ncbi:MAG: ABC transporter permease [Muribaculaceae bacterium]
MNSPLSIIITREYLERVKRKSFIISTILTPLFMILLMIAPALIAMISTPEQKEIAVVDESGMIGRTLQNNESVRFIDTRKTLGELMADEDLYGVLVIGADIIKNPSNVSLYTRGSLSMQLENEISSSIKHTVESIRLKEYNIANLARIMEEINADVSLSTFRLDKDESSETSSVMSYIIGMVMSLMLYMFILLYGQMVMTSIIEEKNNRVLEIVVSSVKPAYLMLGKILGVGLVALTQILIWALIICSVTTWGIPSLVAGVTDGDLLSIFGVLGDSGYMLSLFGYLILFLIGGYLFFSAIYAAIGSAVDNIQDASQLQSVAVIPIILGMVFSMTVVNDPDSTMALWASIVPLTSPMVMMARLPFGIPAWQIVTSLVVLYLSFIFLVWLAAKIYRVGIFMYGKKPSFAELIRWARYK